MRPKNHFSAITIVVSVLQARSVAAFVRSSQRSFLKSRSLRNLDHPLFSTHSLSRNPNRFLWALKGKTENQRHYSQSLPLNMPRGVKKENLPTKVCVTCGRPFTWRKKWEKVWDEVTTCSKSCNRKRRLANRVNGKSPDAEVEKSIASLELNEVCIERRKLRDEEESVNDVDEGWKHEAEDSIYSSNPTMNLEIEPTIDFSEEETERARKAQRKAAKKAKKAERRAQREGRGNPSAGQKSCDMCSASVDLLIRCMYEEGQTEWKMVCGKCWNIASGGVVDGDSNHPHYRYGGLWKNRRAQK